MKKFFKFLGLLIVVAAISFTASVWLSNRKGAPLENPGETGLFDRFNGTQEYHANGALRKLSLEEVGAFFVLSNKNEVRYYVPRTGEVKTVPLQGSSSAKLLATIRPRAFRITWSPDGNEIIADYGTENIYTDLKSGSSKTLGKNILNPEFSKSSSDVAYVYFDAKSAEGTISIADSQFKAFTNILKTRLKNWKIHWNDNGRLSLIATTDGTQLESLFLLDTTTKDLTQLTNEQQGLETNWSPDGQRLVYSRKSGKKVSLFFMALSNKVPEDLGIAIESSKCAWDNDSVHLYCAIPDKTLEDSIVQIDTSSSKISKKTLLNQIDAGFVKAYDLIWVDGIKSLVFKNFKDGRLYVLSLSQ